MAGTEIPGGEGKKREYLEVFNTSHYSDRVSNCHHQDDFWVLIFKEAVGNSRDILNTILGHKYDEKQP